MENTIWIIVGLLVLLWLAGVVVRTIGRVVHLALLVALGLAVYNLWVNYIAP